MPVIDPQRISDGFISLERGIDAGKAPSMLPRNQASFAVNATMRGGFVKTRPGFKGVSLTYKATAPGAAEDIEALFETGRFQGAYNYNYGRNSFLVAAISGYIFKIDVVTKEVSDITPRRQPTDADATTDSTLPDPNSSLINVFYFQQAEQYLVIQDGRNPAIIFDGTTCRRSNPQESEVPVGTAMAYGGGRLWVANGREFVVGDIVGGPTEVIQFTENTYIAEGGAFAVPLDTGDIKAMKFMNQPDSSLGQGELLVHTSEAVFAVNVPTDRDSWKDLNYPIVRIVAINYGSVSDRSCALVNSDMYYRAPDGIRSYISSRREWQDYGQIPVSRELGEFITADTETSITDTVSSVLFDNRLLTTVTAQNSSQGTYFKGLVVLDFDLVGGTGAKAPPAWEGLWTGLDFLQITLAEITGEPRCFVFHRDETCGIQLWELTRDGKKDVSGDNSYSISCYVESPSYTFENPFELKKLEYGEMWIDQLEGQVNFDIKYKPNQYPAWVDWNTFVECAKTDNCDPVAGECLTFQNYKPQYRSRVRLPQPADDCETSVSAPMRNGYELSVRIGWTGHARIKGFRLHAYPIIEEPYGGCGSTSDCV